MPMYLLSSADVGTAGGGRMSAVRYWGGNIETRIHEAGVFDWVDVFCAAVHHQSQSASLGSMS